MILSAKIYTYHEENETPIFLLLYPDKLVFLILSSVFVCKCKHGRVIRYSNIFGARIGAAATPGSEDFRLSWWPREPPSLVFRWMHFPRLPCWFRGHQSLPVR